MRDLALTFEGMDGLGWAGGGWDKGIFKFRVGRLKGAAAYNIGFLGWTLKNLEVKRTLLALPVLEQLHGFEGGAAGDELMAQLRLVRRAVVYLVAGILGFVYWGTNTCVVSLLNSRKGNVT